MRNWNGPNGHKQQDWTDILSLPMRNWNPKPDPNIPSQPPDFESTYEELKLFPVACNLVSLSNFESTYEELKLYWLWRWISSCGFWVYLWGIETSFRLVRLKRQRLILSLPMRNWNYVNPWWTLSRTIILSLPMRNWNWSNWDRCNTKSIILSLPMRNWNYLNHYLCDSMTVNFESTYEELKLSRSEFRSRTGRKFWVYLWGIETMMKRSVSR